jgi:hypothetical protein
MDLRAARRRRRIDAPRIRDSLIPRFETSNAGGPPGSTPLSGRTLSAPCRRSAAFRSCSCDREAGHGNHGRRRARHLGTARDPDSDMRRHRAVDSTREHAASGALDSTRRMRRFDSHLDGVHRPCPDRTHGCLRRTERATPSSTRRAPRRYCSRSGRQLLQQRGLPARPKGRHRRHEQNTWMAFRGWGDGRERAARDARLR